MSIFASPADAAEVRSIYADAIEAVLYSDPPRAVWDLERRTLLTMPALLHPAIPVECARLFVGVFEECEDELAAGALSVLARLASGPVADAARLARSRLSAAGISSEFESEIGTLAARRCLRARVGTLELYTLALARDGDEERYQAAALAIGQGLCGDPVAHWLTVEPPLPADEAIARVEGFRRGGCSTSEVEPGELAAELAGALGHMVEQGCGALYGHELADLAIIEHALVGEAGLLPRPLLRPGIDGSIDDLWEDLQLDV